MIVLDNNALVFLYRPTEHQEIEHQKMQYIFDEAKKNKENFGVPAPVIAEFLIGESNPIKRQEFLSKFDGKLFRVLDFDAKSAIMCALVHDELKKKLQNIDRNTPKQEVKVDRQVIAIAKANNAKLFICNDKQAVNSAKILGLNALTIADIELPENPQGQLF